MDSGSTESQRVELPEEATRRRLTPRLGRWVYWGAVAAIIALAAVLRFYQLNLKPFHHDEGVNGSFMVTLYRNGVYRYDPSNYHGPSLYYLALVSTLVFGLKSFGLRFVTVAFGLLAVWLAVRARRLVGSVGAVAAALILAVSHGMVFFSRYFIHEMLLIAATLGAVLAAERALRTRNGGSVLATGAWAALMFTTKETSVPTVVVLLIALACALGFDALRRRDWAGTRNEILAWLRADEIIPLAVSGVCVFLILSLALYSSFFSYPAGVLGALRALAPWLKTGETAHVHPWWTYFDWLWRAETPVVVLGALGLVAALVKAENRRVTFVAFWALGITAVYSFVPYKTPWLTLNLVLPLALLGGYALDLLARSLPWVAGLALLAAAVPALYRCEELNLRRYDDDRMVYVYAHTQRGFLDLVEAVHNVAVLSGGNKIPITIAAREHWPLPWYLRDYTGAGYQDNLAAARDSVIVICNPDQEERYRSGLGQAFSRLGSYPLRPGVTLIVYVQTQLMARLLFTVPKTP